MRLDDPGQRAESGWRAKAHLPVMLVVVALFLVVVVDKAWVTDDAYITFRSVQNFIEGRGLTWNPGERVQVYTHPLWMLSMSALHAATREFFYSSLALNVVLTLATVLLLAFRVAPTWQGAWLGVAVLTVSRAFTDYSTSGLENALTHFLLVLLLALNRRAPSRTEPVLLFSLVATLCLLTRLDTLFLISPAWAALVWRAGWRRSIGPVLIGVSPLIVWELFSMLYYGSFLPNTAYAKLNTGIPAGEMIAQGFHYMVNSFYWDPVTLGATLIGAGWAAIEFYRRRRSGRSAPETGITASWAWALGIVLMLCYVTRVGGDFMSGRFLTAPLIVGVGLLVTRSWRPREVLVATIALLALLSVPWTSPFGKRDYGDEWHAAIDRYGIADERAFYQKTGSLWASWGKKAWPDPRSHGEARWLHKSWPYDYFAAGLLASGELSPVEGWPPSSRYDEDGRLYRKVFVRGAVGFLGYHLGPRVHVLDYHAVCDPLLSRLPAVRPDPVQSRLIPKLASRGWRVGHYYRRPPWVTCARWPPTATSSRTKRCPATTTRSARLREIPSSMASV